MSASVLAQAEQAVLRTLLLTPERAERVRLRLSPEDFEDRRHALIWRAITALAEPPTGEERTPISVLTVAQELGRAGMLEDAGGTEYLQALIAGEFQADVEPFARLIKEESGKRHLALVGAQMNRLLAEPGRRFTDIATSVGDQIARLASDHWSTSYVSLDEIMDEVIDEIQHGVEAGTPTGYLRLDRLLRGGLKPGQLVVLAAPPGAGKTSFALNIVLNICRAGHVQRRSAPILVFSLEMSGPEITKRLVAIEGQLQDELDAQLQFSERDKERGLQAAKLIRTWPIYLEYSLNKTVAGIRAAVDRFSKETGKPALVVVDYLQLLEAANPSRGRTEVVGEFSRGLKAIAADYGVPVIAVSQLNREVLKRPGHKPQLSDLRESGSIEQDADIVIFVHRDTYFEEDQNRRAELERGGADAQIIIAKQRNGPTGEVTLRFIAAITRFDEPAEETPTGLLEFESDNATFGLPEIVPDEWS